MFIKRNGTYLGKDINMVPTANPLKYLFDMLKYVKPEKVPRINTVNYSFVQHLLFFTLLLSLLLTVISCCTILWRHYKMKKKTTSSLTKVRDVVKFNSFPSPQKKTSSTSICRCFSHQNFDENTHKKPQENIWHYLFASTGIFMGLSYAYYRYQKKDSPLYHLIHAADKQPEIHQKEEEKEEEENTENLVKDKKESNENEEQIKEKMKPEKKIIKIVDGVPEHVEYLIIGAGTAAYSAMKAIRANDPKSKVVLITKEKHLPYMKPPLSKNFWFYPSDKDGQIKFKNALEQNKFLHFGGNERSVFYLHPEFYGNMEELINGDRGGVSVIFDKEVYVIDSRFQEVLLSDGNVISYDKCLVATGSSPKHHTAIDKSIERQPRLEKKVTYFNSLDDFLELKKIVDEPNKKIGVIGGGFLGAELAISLALYRNEKKLDGEIVHIFPENGILGEIRDNVRINDIKLNGNKTDIQLTDKNSLLEEWSKGFDHIVVAIGAHPDIKKLARRSQLELDEQTGGLIVNSELQARTNVWVAGDAASFYDPLLGRRQVQHHDHAIVSGRLAGENMVSNSQTLPFHHQSMFYGDFGKMIGFEAVGICDNKLKTVGMFEKADMSQIHELRKSQTKKLLSDKRAKKFRQDYLKGIIYYLNEDEIVVGMLMWNVFNRVPIARKVLNEAERNMNLKDISIMLMNANLEEEEKKEEEE
ncbi:hypothetical protein SNEBB_001888 [Seison nebaliae]|nr:hypothetical protein SNEBB_001888 [Seison nebaliae]